MSWSKLSGRAKSMVFFGGLCLILLVYSTRPCDLSAQSDLGTEKELSNSEMSHMSPNQLANYVFKHQGCDTCHTLGANGRLGLTERGTQVGNGFEGCISLLTSMNVIAQMEPANRTSEEKVKVTKFSQFGCTTCHKVTPGRLGLTAYGAKLKSMHMACTDVEKILSSRK